MLQGKKILIGITGSIAAYKIPILVRLLTKQGAEVKVIMTPKAADFVSRLVLTTLSRHEVYIDLETDDQWANHVELGRWADVMLIAPASANSIAKMAYGLCDNLLLATYLSATCPIMIAPAMDDDMYHHPTYIENCKRLNSFGHIVIEAEYGELASGLTGKGRMPEPMTLLNILIDFFTKEKKLHGYSVIVTAGPTYEHIDPVRFIGNHSSGKMGIAIADSLASAGASVHLILGPTHLSPSMSSVKVYRVTSADEMYHQAVQLWDKTDIGILSAAVADYTPTNVSSEKIKKTDETFSISLKKTRDILKHLGENKRDNQILIGFALESQDEESCALKKLKDKKADMIIMNSLKDEGAGFGTDTNKVTFFEKNGIKTPLPLMSKKNVAIKICEKIVEYLNPNE
jgi:phosphopantothenoylcysteine decarboxylase/phosphopantothenate--cysteine ligase, prokaryotic